MPPSLRFRPSRDSGRGWVGSFGVEGLGIEVLKLLESKRFRGLGVFFVGFRVLGLLSSCHGSTEHH